MNMWGGMFFLILGLGVLISAVVIIWLYRLWRHGKVSSTPMWPRMILPLAIFFCLVIPIAFTALCYARSLGDMVPNYGIPGPVKAIDAKTQSLASFDVIIRKVTQNSRCNFSDLEVCQLADRVEQNSSCTGPILLDSIPALFIIAFYGLVLASILIFVGNSIAIVVKLLRKAAGP